MLVIPKVICFVFLNLNLINSELLLSHVVFSHGKDVPMSYPGDIYANHPHFIRFAGSLTEEGELSSYLLGQQLRTRYHEFMGNVYLTNLSQSVSTNSLPSQLSIQCVHLGLFPPRGNQTFTTDLNWQPVPYKILKGLRDTFLSPRQFCNQSSWKLPPALKYAQLYKLVTSKTGNRVTTNEDVNHIMKALGYQKYKNFHLPQWLENEANQNILQEIEHASSAFFGQLIQHRLNIGAGKLIQEMIRLSKAKLDHTLIPPDRKMFFYSGDYSNVVLLLSALSGSDVLNSTDLYSSCVLLELHNINGQIGFKLFYNPRLNGESIQSKQFVQLQILDCDVLCLVDDFVSKTRMLYEPEPVCF